MHSIIESQRNFIYCKTCIEGQAKIALSENTINRISLFGIKPLWILATFGNYSGSWLTSSIGVMGTFNHQEREEDSARRRFSLAPCLFGHFYLKRPRCPAPRYNHTGLTTFINQISISLVAGTQVSNPFFEDVFIGAGIGHFSGSLGIVVGANFCMQKDAQGEKTHRRDFFAISLTYIL
ncbi:MAG: hypothetical protein WCC06_06200 [Candidatus Aminicenantales bacterium]